ncbi:MAG: hypothetical protein AAF447_02085 [Myxococcota bacterium]
MTLVLRRAAALLLLGHLVACDLEAAPLDPCAARSAQQEPPPDTLDLLFMVDNSNCTTRDQQRFQDAVPGLLGALLRGEVPASEATDSRGRSFPALRSLRIGVISSDMGIGGFTVPTCTDPLGDDGRLLAFPNPLDPRCPADPPLFLELTREPGLSDDAWAAQVEQLTVDASCLTQLGTNGCGFEQPLEAILKALTPAASALRFQDGTPGRGDENRVEGADPARFLRPGSLLAIIALTDEDDCSVADPELFDPASERYAGDLNLRCFHYPEAVHPVERYVEGLLALRPPERLVYATLAGVPERLNGVDARTILNDPAMQEAIDPANGGRLVPSCTLPETLSFPPRRMVSLASGLEERGARVAVGSLCQRDFGPAMAPVLHAMADALEGVPTADRTCP